MFCPRNEFLLLPPPTLPISSLNNGDSYHQDGAGVNDNGGGFGDVHTDVGDIDHEDGDSHRDSHGCSMNQ